MLATPKGGMLLQEENVMKMTKMAIALNALMRRSGLALGVLALTIDKLEAVPETVRALYVEKDGKFQLDVSGLPVVEDVSGLKSALEKERIAREKAEKARKDFEKRFEGIDPEKTRELMAQFEDADEAKLIAQGKAGIEALILKRTEKMRTEYEKKLTEAGDKINGSLEVASTYMDRVLDNHVRAAAMSVGVHAPAVEDILLRARSIFSLSDEGKAVQFDEDGETVILGKDGKTPFTVTEWLDTMRESAPHWFPVNSSGGGAHGSRQQAGTKEMKRAAFDALGAAEKSKAVKEGTRVVD
jgi:hypothetical protein